MNKLRNFKYLFFLILPVIAVAVWYSPVIFKGHSCSDMTEQIVLGKNIAKTGMYAMESNLNVLLSSSLIKEEGHTSFVGNDLTGRLYALVFKAFGFLNWNQLILFSAILNAITLLIFAFLVFYLFNFRTSLVFSLIYVFFPFNWMETNHLGIYEFALFFISLFFLFYFLGQKSKYSSISYIFSGLFLALAVLARNTFILFIPVFFIYLLFKKEKRTIVLIFVPVFVILSVFYLPNLFTNRNAYLQLIPGVKSSESLEANDFITYGEFFPDPYTYHFDRGDFLKEYAVRRDSPSLIPSLYVQKASVTNAKADYISFGRRILLSFLLLIDHAGRFISWEVMGGPFIFLLILLGLYFLKKEQTSLFWLFVWFISGLFFLFSFVVLVGRQHFSDFNWILTLLATLGLLSIVSILETYFKLDKKKTFLVFVFILVMVLYNLLLAGHTYWGRICDNKNNSIMLEYASKIKKLNIPDRDVIAVGTGGLFGALELNYLKDKSVVVFQQRTVKKLLENGKLNSAFKNFGVKYIVGYPEDLSKKILKEADVINISSNGFDSQDNTEEVAFENYDIKSWLMNFIK